MFSYFVYSVGCDKKQVLNLVKNKIYCELIANKGIHVCQPEMFCREFCISAVVTNIIHTILDAITCTSARHSTERIYLNKRRAESVIYNLWGIYSKKGSAVLAWRPKMKVIPETRGLYGWMTSNKECLVILRSP